MDLDRIVGGALRHLGGEELGHRRLGRVWLPAVLEPRRPVGHEPGRVDLGRHVGDLEGHALEGADGAAELLALLRVGRCGLVGRLRQPERHGRDPDAAAVEGLEEQLVALPLGAEHVPGRDPAVLEDELAGVAGVEAHLLLHPADGEAGRIGLDDEGADLARLLFAIGDRRDDVGPRHAGVRDEALAPVQDPRIAVASRPRPGAARVAARPRLGEPVRADHLA